MNVHRTFEAYYCWCEKLDLPVVDTRNKLAETVLYRAVGSISEHILHCPERLAQEIHEILISKVNDGILFANCLFDPFSIVSLSSVIFITERKRDLMTYVYVCVS